MRDRLVLVAMLLLVCYGPPRAAAVQVLGDSIIHDPSRIIQDGDRYYVYLTGLGGGDGIFFKWSSDRQTWHDPYGNAEQNAIFRDAPDWVASEVPNNDGAFWAPTILKHGDQYRMYYSVSTFGTQESAIGLATNSTLDFTSPNYLWVDQGVAIASEVGYPYNAIDPAVFVDTEERMWMVFGSYWQGIHITELDPVSGKPYNASPAGATRIAGRSSGTDIEAAYIHYQDGYYYLFENWGSCCSGTDSTYEIRVGRSDSPTGPFFDNNPLGPRGMLDGGGTLFLDDVGSMIGPGHAGIFTEDDIDYFGYHFYDATSSGLPRYSIDTLLWDTEGWPLLESQALLADLNQNMVLDPGDWSIFVNYHHADISFVPVHQRALFGDLDLDGDNDYLDFRLFKRYYNAWNGTGALAAAQALRVPEPTTMVLAMMCVVSAGARRRRR